jgi:hypothetical protein
MPFDLVAFGEATPGTGDTAAVAVALSDGCYTTSGDDLIVKESAPYLLGVWAATEAQGARVVLSQPSLNLNYEFLKNALLNCNTPSLGMTDYRGRPLPLVAGEKLNVGVEMIADEDTIVYLLLGSAAITQNMLDNVRPTHVITGEADTTATAFTWTTVTVTWDQDLPKGLYTPVGLVYSYWKTAAPAMPSAARLIFKSQPAAAWRPGVVGSYIDKDHEELQTMDYFPWVDWPQMSGLVFDNNNVPGIEVCSAEAHTDQNFQMTLVKVG